MADKGTKRQKATNSTRDSDETAESLPGGFDLFEPSAKLVLNNLTAFVWLLGLPFILEIFNVFSGPIALHGSAAHQSINGLALSLSLFGVVVEILVAPAVFILQLYLLRRKTMGAAQAFQNGLHYLLKLIGLGIVLILALSIAFMLFVVPFFLLLPRVILSPYFLIDQDLGVFDSIRASNEAYKKHGKLWGPIGVYILLLLPSAIPFIGPIVSAALGYLYQPAFAFRYEQFRLLEAGKRPLSPFEAALKS